MSGSRESCLVTTLLPVVSSVVCSSVDGPCHWIETELSLALWERVTVQVRVYTTPTLPLPEPLTSTDISTAPGHSYGVINLREIFYSPTVTW